MSSANRPFAFLCRIGVLVLLAAFASGCATLRTDLPKPVTLSLPPAADTPSTRYVASETQAHGGDSGFRPLISNTNALMSRVVLIDHAQHSLDLQYYIFDNDATGRLIAQRMLAAADRGVRVRILLDDLDIEGHQHDSVLDALDAHPNIEVRLFNPFKFRNRSIFSKAGQFILDGARVDGKPIVPEAWLSEATRTQVSTGPGTGYGYQWWTRDDGTFEARGIYGQTLHIDRARRLVIVINSATGQPTGRASGQARREFIATVQAEVYGEKR